MEQLQNAEKRLKQMVEHQHREYIQTSEQVSNKYLKDRKTATQRSKIPYEIIKDLNHQISTLEQLQRSGLITEGITQNDIQNLLTRYRQARQSMIDDVEKPEEMQQMKEEEIQVDRNSDMNLDEEREELTEVEKNNKKLVLKKKIITFFLRFAEGGNYLVMIMVVLLVVYEMIKGWLFSNGQ